MISFIKGISQSYCSAASYESWKKLFESGFGEDEKLRSDTGMTVVSEAAEHGHRHGMILSVYSARTIHIGRNPHTSSASGSRIRI
jgi:hypothetical protein